MKKIIKLIHMFVCLFLTSYFISIACLRIITKEEYICAVFFYLYMIILLLALFEEN